MPQTIAARQRCRAASLGIPAWPHTREAVRAPSDPLQILMRHCRHGTEIFDGHTQRLTANIRPSSAIPPLGGIRGSCGKAAVHDSGASRRPSRGREGHNGITTARRGTSPRPTTAMRCGRHPPLSARAAPFDLVVHVPCRPWAGSVRRTALPRTAVNGRRIQTTGCVAPNGRRNRLNGNGLRRCPLHSPRVCVTIGWSTKDRSKETHCATG